MDFCHFYFLNQDAVFVTFAFVIWFKLCICLFKNSGSNRAILIGLISESPLNVTHGKDAFRIKESLIYSTLRLYYIIICDDIFTTPNCEGQSYHTLPGLINPAVGIYCNYLFHFSETETLKRFSNYFRFH